MNLVINAQLHGAQQSASLILISRCASAPRGRANLARGAARGHGRERRAKATGAGCSCWLRARGEEAAAGGPDTAPRGSSACPPARVSTAVSRRVQPSSPAARAAAVGAKSTSSRSFPQAAPRHRGLWPHTRAPTAARFLRSRKKNQNSKPEDAGMREQGWRRCADSGVPKPRQEYGRQGARPSPSVGPEEPGARGQRRQDLHPAHAPPLRPGARLCRRPFLTCRVSGPGGRRGGSADAGGEELGFGESDGRRREEPRHGTAAEGGWSPQQSPRILR